MTIWKLVIWKSGNLIIDVRLPFKLLNLQIIKLINSVLLLAFVVWGIGGAPSAWSHPLGVHEFAEPPALATLAERLASEKRVVDGPCTIKAACDPTTFYLAVHVTLAGPPLSPHRLLDGDVLIVSFRTSPSSPLIHLVVNASGTMMVTDGFGKALGGAFGVTVSTLAGVDLELALPLSLVGLILHQPAEVHIVWRRPLDLEESPASWQTLSWGAIGLSLQGEVVQDGRCVSLDGQPFTGTKFLYVPWRKDIREVTYREGFKTREQSGNREIEYEHGRRVRVWIRDRPFRPTPNPDILPFKQEMVYRDDGLVVREVNYFGDDERQPGEVIEGEYDLAKLPPAFIKSEAVARRGFWTNGHWWKGPGSTRRTILYYPDGTKFNEEEEHDGRTVRTTRFHSNGQKAHETTEGTQGEKGRQIFWWNERGRLLFEQRQGRLYDQQGTPYTGVRIEDTSPPDEEGDWTSRKLEYQEGQLIRSTTQFHHGGARPDPR